MRFYMNEFISGTLREAYKEEEELLEMVSSVAFKDADITVYAVWGYDTNGNGTADIFDGEVPGVSASDVTVTYDGAGYGFESYTVTGVGGSELATTDENGESLVTITYYSDADCTQELDSAPTEVGVYYAKVTYVGSDNDESEFTVATITINPLDDSMDDGSDDGTDDTEADTAEEEAASSVSEENAKTGDGNLAGFWLILILISAGAVAGVAVRRKIVK